MSPPHDSARAPPARPSRGHQPSFSAALLDAIYQSLEADADADARSSTETRPAPASPAQRTPGSSRHHRPTAAVSSPARSSVRSPRLQRPPRPCRVRPDPQSNSILLPPPLPPPHEPTGDRAEKKKKSRKSKRTSKTKTAPFACLLNAILCNRRPARSRSVEHTPRATAAAFAAAPEPASARSILSSRASRRESAATGGVLTPARRAVRFSPVAVVVDDERGGGAVGTATRLRDAGEMETMVQAKESAAETERRVEELLRALGVAEERERAKESSESSSDLFELEGLPAFEDAEPPRPRASAGAGLLARPRPRVV
ncbi:protein BIG GRAIN 1-like B [Panicum miliaceum]|uniref:Protein BIG GRAIN 1-like B n=1 Tax=Panicum miliaceum TaxID=4540 RepID=A0A3L6RNI0_PANMI|nr:protein BIG GRAIN 1-like B [Panicum miliaceum]